jgi:MFS transporter, DHA3 family, macrolide efflux protein
MQAFLIFWMGQVISLLGSAMTWFAFTLWVWQKTGQATSLATVSFLAFLPSILFMPIAGTFVDRWERKRTLAFSDMASALATLSVLILYTSNNLDLWHIYVLSLLTGFFNAFQYPAYMATITTIVPKEHYSRAQGMIGLAHVTSSLFAPMLAAALLPILGLSGIMTIDLLTFLAAFGVLLWIKIPPRPPLATASATQTGFSRNLSFGFSVIFSTPSLRALTILFSAANFFLAIGATLLSPTILSRASNNENTLAMIMTIGALGGIIGGSLLSIWGGPKRRVNGILFGGAGACLMGISLFGLARSVPVWALAGFFFSFFEPFVEGGNAAIWQSTVDVNAQGRVFSARQLLTQIPYLIGVASSGWLADMGMSHFTGTQNGIHLSVTLLLAGILGSFIFITGSFHPAIRLMNKET